MCKEHQMGKDSITLLWLYSLVWHYRFIFSVYVSWRYTNAHTNTRYYYFIQFVLNLMVCHHALHTQLILVLTLNIFWHGLTCLCCLILSTETNTGRGAVTTSWEYFFLARIPQQHLCQLHWHSCRRANQSLLHSYSYEDVCTSQVFLVLHLQQADTIILTPVQPSFSYLETNSSFADTISNFRTTS